MEEEYKFWETNRTAIVTKNGKTYQLATYNVAMRAPRPESYREDVHLAETQTEDNRKRLYKELASGAESGWDYSTRWFVRNKTNNGKYSFTNVRIRL